MEPINYMVNVPDPAARVFEGYAQGLGAQGARQQMAVTDQNMELAAAQEARNAELHPYDVQGAQLGLDGQRQGLEAGALGIEQQRRQMATQQAAAARKAEFDAAMGRLAALGPNMTIADISAVTSQFPEFAESVNASVQAMGEPQRLATSRLLGQAAFALRAGNTDTAMSLVDQYATAAENSGDEAMAATARGLQQIAEADPNAALSAIGAALYAVDPDAAANIFDAGETLRVQTSQMVGPTISVQTMSDGSTRVVDTATNTVLQGEEARAAMAAAQQSEVDLAGQLSTARAAGTRETALNYDPQIAAATTAAENAAEAQTVGPARAAAALGGEQSNMVVEALQGVSRSSGSVANIRQALSAIDAGASSGILAGYIPTITEETASLENAMNRMGLDVVGSVTFGALSEGELRLAMETAAPRSLRPEVLRPWLERRLAAEEQVRAALLDKAEFLSDPNNSISDWVQSVRDRERGTPPPQPTQGGEYDDLFSTYGGN